MTININKHASRDDNQYKQLSRLLAMTININKHASRDDNQHPLYPGIIDRRYTSNRRYRTRLRHSTDRMTPPPVTPQ